MAAEGPVAAEAERMGGRSATQTASPAGPLRRILGLAVRLGLLAAVIYYTGRVLLQRLTAADWQEVHFQAGPLVLAVFLLLGAGGLSVVSYRLLVRGFWPAVPPWRAMAAIAWLPEIAKYLPGRVANVATSLWLFHRNGVPAAVVVGVLFVLNGLAVLSGLIVAAPLTLWGPINHRLPGAWWWCLVLIGLGLLCLYPVVFRTLGNLALRLVRRPQLEVFPKARDYVGPFVLMLLGRMLAGVSLWLVARSVTEVPASQIPLFTAGLALAGTFGYLAFFAPAGIGVREGVLLMVLTPAIGGVPAAVVVVVLRLVQMVVEISLGGIGLVLLKSEMKATQAGQSHSFRNIALCLAVLLPICLLGTWRLDVISMEGIIALGGRDMLRTHAWFVPRLYGTIYAFKPSLAYWMAGASETLLGARTEIALRLPFALCAIAWGLITYAGVKRLAGARAGLYAALALSTSGLFIEQARIAGYDMPLALGVGVAMLSAWQCLVRRQADWRWWVIGYAALAMGFLAKGLPALGMFFPGLLLACIVTRQVRQLFRWQHLLGVAVLAVLVAGYLLLAYHEAGWKAFGDQLREISYRSARWDMRYVLASLVKPLIIFGVALPWSILLVVPVLNRRLRLAGEGVSRLAWVAGAFLAADLAIWMVTTTTSTRYYLPLMTPIAVLAGLVGEALVVSRAAGDPDPGKGRLVSGGRWGWGVPLVLTLVGLVYSCVYIGLIEPRRVASRSMRPVAAMFTSNLPADAKVYIDTDDSCSSLFYYLGHEVSRWSTRGKPPKAPMCVVLVNDRVNNQLQTVQARNDLRVEVLATCSGPEGRTYTLARISRGP